jgi:hypothetical protein
MYCRTKILFLLSCSLLLCSDASAQTFVRQVSADTLKTITLEGYADIYFGYDFNEPTSANRPYAVSQSRHNEININLAYLSLKYNSPRARVTFTPGFGTYMNANYAAEKQTLQYIIEANIGVKPFKNKDVWIDAGVFVAPYTTETALAHDQLLYSRSCGAEYSPYYLTGVRGTLPLGRKVTLWLYLINGWQVIQDVNTPLAFASALQWNVSEKLSLNWSTFAGNEHSDAHPNDQARLLSDLSCSYSPTKRLSLSANGYVGSQKQKDSSDREQTKIWYQFNLNGRYYFTNAQSVGFRTEYFRDEHAVIAIPITGFKEFDCFSFSLGYNINITENISFHAEGRYYKSANEIFINKEGKIADTDVLMIGGITAKF